MELILASTSKGRMQALKEANIPFLALEPLEDEEDFKHTVSHLTPSQQALELARIKARKLSQQNPEKYVLGGDQICEFNGAPINKPSNREDVLKQLNAFSGKHIYLRAAISLWHGGKEIWHHLESPKSIYQNYTPEEAETALNESINAGFNPIGCAGGFQLESPVFHKIIKKIEGHRHAIIGLPTEPLKQFLKTIPKG